MLLEKPYADPSAIKILLDVIAESNPKAKNVNLASLVDSSFVERKQGQQLSDQCFSVGVEPQRVTCELDSIVVVATNSEVANDDYCRLDEN